MAKKIGAGLYMECSALKKDGSCAYDASPSAQSCQCLYCVIMCAACSENARHVVERTALQVLRGPRKPQPGPAPPRPGLPFVPKYSLKNGTPASNIAT